MKTYLPTSYAAAAIELVKKGYSPADVSKVLIHHLRKAKRSSLVYSIAEHVEELAKLGEGEVVDVYTTHPVDAQDKKNIADLAHELYGVKVSLREHEDRSLIGGIILRRGDEVTDYSVATLVAKLHTYLKQ